MKKKILICFLLVLSALVKLSAQCAMCAAVAESSKENGSSAALGLNNGILYLFLTPYIIVATILYFWIKARRKAQQTGEATQSN